jgi:hypothetical protein
LRIVGGGRKDGMADAADAGESNGHRDAPPLPIGSRFAFERRFPLATALRDPAAQITQGQTFADDGRDR